jgi:hypothetical protein
MNVFQSLPSMNPLALELLYLHEILLFIDGTDQGTSTWNGDRLRHTTEL